MEYEQFLKNKTAPPPAYGIEPGPMHESLYDYQRAIVAWAIRRGRAAIFADCGLGKTRMQIEWARQSGKRVLMVAPLGVLDQTIAEGAEMGVTIARVSEPTDDAIQITNYHKLHKFVDAIPNYDAIVLDESSILKSLDGRTRTLIIKQFSAINRRLACTATPAPNDIAELGNHAEFLGIMSQAEMLATYFVNALEQEGKWRLKGHAKDKFWAWVARWGCFLRRPSDIGFDDSGYNLPPLDISECVVDVDFIPDGQLFRTGLGGISERRQARKASVEERIAAAVKRMDDGKQWLVWVGLNDEGDKLEFALGDQCAQISGADSDESKLSKERAWRKGDKRILITKPSMFGFGMNWQHCDRMLFLGLGDSYEQYYQSVRRSWRFGQKSDKVQAVIVVSAAEREVVANVRRKEKQAIEMAESVARESRQAVMYEIQGRQDGKKMEYKKDDKQGDGWAMMLGDCTERIKEIPTGSIGMSVFSPPFAHLYTYSDSERDMGNAKNNDEFLRHFSYLLPELRRVIMPGRLVCVHVADIALQKAKDGVIAMHDFSGDVIREFVKAGFLFAQRVTIDKNPQVQSIRTRTKGLAFHQKNKDSSHSRPAMADYLLLFKAPGENVVPVETDVTNEEWIVFASPVWYDIEEGDTLNARAARSEKDERHICPLQLGLIERAVRLWSNKGETVLSPFAGIGSEGFKALEWDRKFVGIELKPEYFAEACKNLTGAKKQASLFAEQAV